MESVACRWLLASTEMFPNQFSVIPDLDNDLVGWCEQYIKGEWTVDIQWMNNNPFTPVMLFSFKEPSDLTFFILNQSAV